MDLVVCSCPILVTYDDSEIIEAPVFVHSTGGVVIRYHDISRIEISLGHEIVVLNTSV